MPLDAPASSICSLSSISSYGLAHSMIMLSKFQCHGTHLNGVPCFTQKPVEVSRHDPVEDIPRVLQVLISLLIQPRGSSVKYLLKHVIYRTNRKTERKMDLLQHTKDVISLIHQILHSSQRFHFNSFMHKLKMCIKTGKWKPTHCCN